MPAKFQVNQPLAPKGRESQLGTYVLELLSLPSILEYLRKSPDMAFGSPGLGTPEAARSRG
jgi:hypothetical protein